MAWLLAIEFPRVSLAVVNGQEQPAFAERLRSENFARTGRYA